MINDITVALKEMVSNIPKDIKESLDSLFNSTPQSLPPFHDNKATNPNFLDPYFNPFTSLTIYDPLILDLNGDGIKTTTLNDGVYFDHNGDDISFKTSQVDKNDALLVLDKNSNNKIDNGNELFRNFTEIINNNNPNNKTFAINGFHALKEYDLNNNNIIDSKDDIYENLKLWQDKNSNGLVDNDELFTLEEKV